jgi:hypothetical protein
MGVVGIGTDGLAWVRQQRAPFGEWDGWSSVPGTTVKSLSAVPIGNSGGI